MSSRKFRFVSPGIFLKEVDQSQLPKESEAVGPLIIGRTLRGPALRPIKVNSMEEMERIFGMPVPGGKGEDVWREGGSGLAPTYASYAAQAYLASDTQTPVNIVRLLGIAEPGATGAGAAGWAATQTHGVFLCRSSSITDESGRHATLAAILHTDTADMNFRLEGFSEDKSTETLISGSNLVVRPNSNGDFVLLISNAAATEDVSTGEERIPFNFNRTSEKFIRKALNTNPVVTNDQISVARAGSLEDKYWLAESFEEIVRIERSGHHANSAAGFSITGSGGLRAFTARLVDGANDAAAGASGPFGQFQREAQIAKSGWVFSQDVTNAANYDPTAKQKLFRIHAINQGYDSTRDFKISIQDIKIADDDSTNPYGSFDVVVRSSRDIDTNPVVREMYSSCNLNPRSPDYIGRKIGDAYFEWDSLEKRYKHYGNYLNVSDLIRVEVHPDVDNGLVDAALVPFGFYGPVIPRDINLVELTGSAVDGTHDHNSAGGSANAIYVAEHGSQGAASADAGSTSWVTGSNIDFVKATTTFTFGDSEFDDHADSTIALIDGSGRTVTYKIKASGADAAAQEFNDGADAPAAAGAFVTLVNSANGHNGTIKASRADAVVTLEQNIAGHVGNTAVTVSTNWNAITDINVTDFSGGDRLGVSPYIAKHTEIFGGANVALDKLKWPSPTCIISGSIGSSGGLEKTYFGWTTEQLDENGARTGVGQYYYGWTDQIRPIGTDTFKDDDSFNADTQKYSFVFSLDDVRISSAAIGDYGTPPDPDASGEVKRLFWERGSRTGSALEDQSYTATAAGSAAKLLRLGVDRFTMPLVGGFDGVDITEADPFNNRTLKASTTAISNYAYASVERAIDSVRDAEVVECNVITAPGITEPTLTKKIVDAAESRADALAIIDLPDVYVPPFEELCTNFRTRTNKTTAKRSAQTLKQRNINSSYGCAYYPWVKIYDGEHDAQVWVPPSVIALGVFGYTEQRDELWFAPAGFNRGGLNAGNAGFPVLNTSEQLSSKERDVLYEAGINPIAKFPAEGIVVFGQKTLQVTRSALDRINVRRLLIFIKKEVSRIAATIIFDQNVPATWSRFLGQVKPFLDSVKTRLGLSDYKVILDESTTTPDLVDRNIMYAKIFLKPARAIEFIAIDFIITRTGASFED